MFLINSSENFETLKSKLTEGKVFIFQKLINMRKDLRVIIIGNEIVLHYWRLNNEKEWKPTSTSFGSSVDFISFPENHRLKIINDFKKLEILSGAFDICWENDDVNSDPIYLEVSSFYQANPDPSRFDYNIPYGKTYSDWKKTILGKHSFTSIQIKNLSYIQSKLSAEIIKVFKN